MTEKIPLIETITGTFHAVNCKNPDACPNDCGGRMTTKQAVALTRAVRNWIEDVLDDVA